MKNLVLVLFLLVFSSMLFCQQQKKIKRILWAEDPVNLNYNGSPGMLTIKYLDDPKCVTLGGSGKKTTGMGGKGMIIDIDSVNFFTQGNKIYSGKVYACGNETAFPDGLERSKILIVKKIIINDRIQFVPDPGLQEVARTLNLLIERLDRLEKKVEAMASNSNKINSGNSKPEEEFLFWHSAWPYIIGVIIVGTIVYLLWPQEEIASVPPAGVPPGGSTGMAFKNLIRKFIQMGFQIKFCSN